MQHNWRRRDSCRPRWKKAKQWRTIRTILTSTTCPTSNSWSCRKEQVETCHAACRSLKLSQSKHKFGRRGRQNQTTVTSAYRNSCEERSSRLSSAATNTMQSASMSGSKSKRDAPFAMLLQSEFRVVYPSNCYAEK